MATKKPEPEALSKEDVIEAFKILAVEDQADVLEQTSAYFKESREAKRQELLKELERYGGIPQPEPVKRGRKPRQPGEKGTRVVKITHRGPDGQTWSSRGQIPRWARDLGATSREDMEKWRVEE